MSFIPRLFLTTLSTTTKEMSLEGSLARYLVKVLRLKEGDRFRGFNPQGQEYDLILKKIDLNQTLASVLGQREALGDPQVGSITLAQGLPKASKMDLILRQCTEVGVGRFIPLITRHSVSRPDISSFKHKNERWRKILVEACRQCGRSQVPELDALTDWEAVLGLFKGFDLVLMPYEKEAPALKTALESVSLPKKVLILVGAEGGWSREELFEAEENGASPIHLPTPILRTETAGIAIVSMIRFFWESSHFSNGEGER